MDNNIKEELYMSINILEKCLKRVKSSDKLGLDNVASNEDDINLLKEILTRFDKGVKELKQLYFKSTLQSINKIMIDKIPDREYYTIITKIQDIYEHCNS